MAAVADLGLPEEIVTDILVRLPVKPLARFRCVSKPWRSLINNHYFIRKHLNYRTNVYNNCMENEYESAVLHVPPTSITNTTTNKIKMGPLRYMEIFKKEEEGVGDSKKIPTFSVKELDCPSELSSSPCLIRACCDGILFIVTRDSIFLWNPSIKVYKKLHNNKFHCKDVFGIGYDPTVDDYKIFRAPNIRHQSAVITNTNFSVQVLALKSNSWKTLQDDFPYITTTGDDQYPIFTNGRIHWVARHDVTREAVILYFDVVEEKLGEVPLPRRGSDLLAPGGMQLLKGNLCVVQYETESLIELWVMKEYGVRESWIKLMTVPNFPPHLYYGSVWVSPFCWTRTGVILSINRTGDFLMYNTKDESFEKIFISDLGDLSRKILYVESLVSPSADCMASVSSACVKITNHQWTVVEDEKLVECLFELFTMGSWKCERGFKSGYLGQLEKMMEIKLPRCGVKAYPHIELRIKTLKKHIMAIAETLTNGTGFAWNEELMMAVCEKLVFDLWAETHSEVAGLRNKQVPHYHTLVEILMTHC